MARRSEDWNLDLARRLRNPTFARAFLLAALDEGLTIQEALGKVIRTIGVTEVAAQIGMPRPTVQRRSARRTTPPRGSWTGSWPPSRSPAAAGPREGGHPRIPRTATCCRAPLRVAPCARWGSQAR